MQKLLLVLLLTTVAAVLGAALWLHGADSVAPPVLPPGAPIAEPSPVASATPAPPRPLLEVRQPAAGQVPEFERIVLVSLDTVRADHLSFHGYPRATTPFLAGLAERGVVFEQAFASISHTGPSHATMLTGLPPILHGVQKNGDELDPTLPNLPQVLSAAGFETAAYLSVGFLGAIAGGFDHVQSTFKTGEDLVQDAIRWVRDKRTRDRFFLWFHLYEPHEWYLTDYGRPEHVDAVRASSSLAGDAFYEYLHDLHALRTNEAEGQFEIEWLGATGKGTNVVPESREQVVRFIDSYDGLLHQADSYVGRLYAALEELDLPGRTLWIVTSDHGEGLGSHGYSGHGARIYGEQLAVPLVVHASDGSLGPRRVRTPVQHTDLLPTLAELVGAEVRYALSGLVGQSFRAELTESGGGATRAPERSLFAQRKLPRDPDVKNALFSLQTADEKLLWYRDEAREEYYDLRTDPLETRDLSDPALASQARLRARLRAQLEAFEEHGPGRSDEPLPPEVLEELRRLGYTD